jgi:hypothetical protein
MDSPSAGTWRLLFRLALGAAGATLLIVWIVVLVAEVNGSSSTDNQNAFGHLTALLVLALFTVAVRLMGGNLSGFILGKDNRISTSKVQVVIWTYAIAGALLSLIAATWVGPDTGFDKLTDPDFNFEDYLVLLGGPFAAAVLARAIVGSQVANGDAAKPPGEPSASQVFTNDAGDADLVDCQYLLFNLVALVYFLGAFLESPAGSLPDIPTVLFILTGASAAGYVSNKAIASGKPSIMSLFPAKGKPGTDVEIFGAALLFPIEEGAEVEAGSAAAFHPVRVIIGDVEAAPVDGTVTHTKSGDDRLKAKVPTLDAGQYDVKVLNFRGTPSDVKQFEVLAP